VRKRLTGTQKSYLHTFRREKKEKEEREREREREREGDCEKDNKNGGKYRPG
jgi:hypothetical protein